MSSVEVKAAVSLNASGPGFTTLYTVPVGKQAVVRTVTATNTSQDGTTIAPFLGLRRSGTLTLLSNSSILANASANLLPAAITMIAGDELVATETSGSSFGAVILSFFPNGTKTIGVAIVDVNTIICCNSTGIYRSTDAGVTFTQVSSLSCSTAIRAAKIGTDYFIYQSTTSAFRSTDSGATWTTQAVTNGPSPSEGTMIASRGRIVYNGTVYGGLTTNTQLSTTTNGITWTNVAAAFPNPVNCLVWSGTHWVAGRDGTLAQIYRSTNGASWSTVTARIAIGAGAIGGLATDGAGVVITGSGGSSSIIGRSADNGATWADVETGTTISASSSSPPINYIGSNFILGAAGTGSYVTYSPTALVGSFIVTKAAFIFTAAGLDAHGINSTSVFYTKNGLRKSSLTIPTAFAGMDVTAAILEVTP